MEYINAVPNSKILIVNTDFELLNQYRSIADMLLRPNDNVSVFTSENYNNAIKIIDETPIDILITSYRFHGTMGGESGFDLCKHMKQKNPHSVCVLISLIIISDVPIFHMEGHKEVDLAYDSGVRGNYYKMFYNAFDALVGKLAAKAKQGSLEKGTNV